MTQDYALIELNENTPEPKGNHAYYLVAVEYEGVTDYKLLYFNSLLWYGIGGHGPVAWPTVRELLLSDIAGVDGTVTIQSLAAHDAQMRAEAWSEGHERGWEDGMKNAEPASPNPYRKENYLYKSNGLQREEQK